MATAGIILCGGQSSRMGRPKEWLPFGDELLLPRIVRIVDEATDRVVVVASVGQSLPPLPQSAEVAYDAVADQGPLQGLAAGLHVAQSWAEDAFLVSCDAPLLSSAVVMLVLREQRGFAAAAPRIEAQPHPLTAAYSVDLLTTIDELLARGERRMRALLSAVNTNWLDAEQVRAVDPELHSLFNVNTPEEYSAALAIAGF